METKHRIQSMKWPLMACNDQLEDNLYLNLYLLYSTVLLLYCTVPTSFVDAIVNKLLPVDIFLCVTFFCEPDPLRFTQQDIYLLREDVVRVAAAPECAESGVMLRVRAPRFDVHSAGHASCLFVLSLLLICDSDPLVQVLCKEKEEFE